MVHINPLLLAAAAAGVVSAVPTQKTTTVPLTFVNNAKSYKSIYDSGVARLSSINKGSTREDFATGSITNEDVSYVANVVVGNGGATYSLIVDTGSSNTWVGANKAYNPGSTGQDTGNSVSVDYGSGSFSGEEYTDLVSFAGLTVRQSIGDASQSTGFNNVDGIIGFGPVDLTQGTVSNTNEVPTFMDNLKSQGKISQEVLGVFFQPESGSDDDDTNGELSFGGPDSSKYTGSISYVPVATSGEASYYWGVNIAAFKYGSTTLSTGGQGIVDTGTTLIYIASGAYSKFLKASGGTADSSTGLTSYTRKPTGNFAVQLGSHTFTLTPSQYLIPQAQYGFFGLSSGKYYSYIVNGGTGAVSTIIGQKFLENYYSVFDTTNQRVGFATRT